MNKEFIPYKEALALKELGFDEPCLASYYHAGKKLDICEYVCNGEYTVLAPLYQQAFRWFREKHQICSWIEFDFHMFDVIILNGNNGERIGLISSMGDLTPYHFYTYEEAKLACLRKLIELVKLKE